MRVSLGSRNTLNTMIENVVERGNNESVCEETISIISSYIWIGEKRKNTAENRFVVPVCSDQLSQETDLSSGY
jgi:hypothetical protein